MTHDSHTGLTCTLFHRLVSGVGAAGPESMDLALAGPPECLGGVGVSEGGAPGVGLVRVASAGLWKCLGGPWVAGVVAPGPGLGVGRARGACECLGGLGVLGLGCDRCRLCQTGVLRSGGGLGALCLTRSLDGWCEGACV